MHLEVKILVLKMKNNKKNNQQKQKNALLPIDAISRFNLVSLTKTPNSPKNTFFPNQLGNLDNK